MRGLTSKFLTPITVAGLAAALGLLAMLQYRWIGEISEADRNRLERGLETSVRQFRAELNRELARLAAWFDADPSIIAGRRWDVFAERFRSWEQRVANGLAISELYVAESTGNGAFRYFRLNPATGLIEEEAWPKELEEMSFEWRGFGGRRPPGPGPGGPGGGPGWGFVAAVPALVTPLTAQDMQMFNRPRPGPPPQDERFRRPEGGGFAGFLVLKLDAEFLTQVVFPDLTARYFDMSVRPGYLVSVELEDPESAEPPRVMYSSSPEIEEPEIRSSAHRFPLIWTRDELATQAIGRFGFGGRYRGNRRPPPAIDGRPPEGEPPPGARPRSPVSVGQFGGGGDWVLLARHREGSVDEVVAALRRRNLVISSGILALLVAGMAIVLVSTRRAQRLAQLQMDFVAGVSHELRTPLAVIRSAADNLAEGVIQSDTSVREYGSLIRSEGRRLTAMVEQTLQFAALQSGKKTYQIETVEPGRLVREALEGTEAAASEAGIEMETRIPDSLPSVRVDAAAARVVVENLIHNAIKYRDGSNWVGVEIEAQGTEVLVYVKDRGFGIEPEDLPQIFEPFYRGRRAREGQIKGSGLGLSLAKDSAEAFGGRLTVESRPGEGSVFTLHLPVANRGDGGETG